LKLDAHLLPSIFIYFKIILQLWDLKMGFAQPEKISLGGPVDTAWASETKLGQADGIPSFFKPWSTNLLVSVGQTTRHRINYFYVNEATAMSEHRAPTH